MKPRSTHESGHPVIDETAFQQLLSAAYVMQEHNSRLKKAPRPTAESTTAVSAKTATAIPSTPPASSISIPATAQPPSAGATCQECGSVLALNEFFCENCGAPTERTNNTTQKNWASLWEMHQTSQPEAKISARDKQAPSKNAKAAQVDGASDEEIDLFPAELEEIVGKFSPPEIEEDEQTESDQPEIFSHDLSLVRATPQPETSGEGTAIAPPSSAWTSAAKARAWLDSLTPPQKSKDWFRDEWNFHRGIISIALASAVLLAVLFQWVTRPTPVPGQSRELSAFEQILVKVGLAEPPPPTSLSPQPGNPNTKVWVDVHTALYYCPGADLYGKTADGKYTSQLDAQRDNFQPSTLKACD